LRKVLADHDKFDFSSALTGIDMLSPTHLSEMIGPNYDALISSLARTKTIRNKLFHGQVTSEGLTREALTKSIADVVSWSSALSAFAYSQFGYDGFNLSSSYTKHADEGFSSTLKLQLTSVENFEHLIKDAHRKGKALLHQSS
jgi:hypothetical protein